ncbi:MAG: glycosyltransferase family 1 protein [Dehalococcoidia bacterium]|jgi:glycosyltransferase involved in cell wall biosynthesis
MKIVHWNLSKQTLPMSGVQRYEDELYANIKELGKGNNIDIERMRRTRNTVAAWFSDYKILNADIVHATSQTVAPAVFIKRPGRFVVTVLDLIPLVYPSVLRKDLSVRLQWMLTPGALKRVDKIIAISEFTKKEIIRLLDIHESKICTVYLAADRSRYFPMDKMECRKKLGLSLSDKYVLVIASNNENKRMDLVQEIFSGLRKRREDVKLIKAGYAEKLSGEGIINAGFISEDDMPVLYNSADVFLNTSEYEGFCLPVLEAMSCGIPVVASNKASIPEVVGSYGNMVDLDAEDVIEQFVGKILDSIDIGLDEGALEQSKKFSWQKTAEETIEVYRNVYGTLA